jgi:oligopeptide/dipeptide ABC transporter ATP-binding protein
MSSLLDIEKLSVQLPTARGTVHAVRDVSFTIAQGEMLALVGESGCGKSVTAQALTHLLPNSAIITAQRATFDKQSLLSKKYQRGIAMIFQNPMATFNPVLTIGYQIAEPLRQLHGYNRKDAEQETIRLLERMKITEATQKAQRYAHEFSGGMLQRAAIAMALACKPQLLIADEPTTALDISTQHEVMALLAELRTEHALAILFITHDLGLVNRHADRIAVMYAGEIIETANTNDVLKSPAHPYTRALLAALPTPDTKRLLTLEGSPPDLRTPPAACAFAERCSQVMPVCTQQSPPVVDKQHAARCWLHEAQKA